MTEVTPNMKPQPVRIGKVPVNDLSNQLLWSAAWSARAVVTAYTSDDDRERLLCAFEAGAAVEWLVRAALAAHSPSLLADRNSPDSLLAFSNVNTPAIPDVSKLRTIKMAEALALIMKIDPTLPVRSDIEEVMAVRNGAAHLAAVSQSSLPDTAARLARIVHALLPLLERTESEFWTARLLPLSVTLRAEFETVLRARIESKLTAARARVTQMVDGLSEDARESTLRLLENRPVPWTVAEDVEERSHPCPACGRKSQLTYLRIKGEMGEVVVEESQHGDVDAYVLVPVTLVPALLQCPVCALMLDAGEDDFSQFPEITELAADEDEVVDVSNYNPDIRNWDD